MNLQEQLDEMLNDGNKIMEVKVYNDSSDSFRAYTSTDGKGGFPLSKDGSVFFSVDKTDETIQEIDGKPHSKNKRLNVYEFKRKLGFYDDNFKRHEAFKSLDDVIEHIDDNDMNEDEFNDFTFDWRD